MRHTAVVPLHTLVVMRHADAASPRPGQPDVDRPLTSTGHRRAASRRSAVIDLDPALVLCSAAVRARQTLEGLGPLRGAVHTEQALYEASATALLLRLAEVEEAAGTVMVIGHMPTVAQVVDGLLLGEQPVGFRPAALVALDIAVTWAQLRPGAATVGLRLA